MSNKRLRMAAAVLAALCASASQASGAIRLDNALAQCVDLRPGARTTSEGLVLLQAQLDVKQSIGHCGCKSAIATYTAQVELDGGQQGFLQSGSLRIRESGARTLTLASDMKLVGDRAVVLSLGCARPD